MSASDINSERTAIRGVGLSRPVRLAVQSPSLRRELTVFDYGCGWSDDIRRLTSSGITCQGLNPHSRPDTPPLTDELRRKGVGITTIYMRERKDV